MRNFQIYQTITMGNQLYPAVEQPRKYVCTVLARDNEEAYARTNAGSGIEDKAFLSTHSRSTSIGDVVRDVASQECWLAMPVGWRTIDPEQLGCVIHVETN